MENHEGGENQEALVSRVKERITRVNESAQALTTALGLPKEAKHEVIARMASGERSTSDTLSATETQPTAPTHVETSQGNEDDPQRREE